MLGRGACEGKLGHVVYLSLVNGDNQLTVWQRWVRQPQRIWLRRAFFQLHLWSGIAVGLYILMISVTGSVLVYWNEIYKAATPAPIISKESGPRLSYAQLKVSAQSAYPDYRITKINRPPNPDQAVDVWFSRGGKTKRRLFDPRSGSDLGDTIPTRFWLVEELLDLHDNLLAGESGKKSEWCWRVRGTRASCDGNGDLVAGEQRLAPQSDPAARPWVEALELAVAQRDRFLELRVHAGILPQRRLPLLSGCDSGFRGPH